MIGPFIIINRRDPSTLPPKSGRYLVVFRQGERVERVTEDYLKEEKRWLTGFRDVVILAWCECPDIPKQLLPEQTEEES